MAVSGKVRQKQYKARQKVRHMDVLLAVDTMPPELAADCKMWISPPGLDDERPRINWDIGRETAHLIKAHANAYGVTIDEVLYEVGRQFCMKKPQLYWAMKSAKINISNN